jgi:hypothetical protein
VLSAAQPVTAKPKTITATATTLSTRRICLLLLHFRLRIAECGLTEALIPIRNPKSEIRNPG